jgi:hypothetical protein
MKSRLPVSNYPKAWKQYNRRWYAVWIGLLAGLLYLLVAIDYASRARKKEFIPILTNLAQSPRGSINQQVLMLVVILPAVAIVMIPYIRFDSWHCPRCGFSFKLLGSKMPTRADSCGFCGLRRNAVSEFDDSDNGKTWQECGSEEDDG